MSQKEKWIFSRTVKDPYLDIEMEVVLYSLLCMGMSAWLCDFVPEMFFHTDCRPLLHIWSDSFLVCFCRSEAPSLLIQFLSSCCSLSLHPKEKFCSELEPWASVIYCSLMYMVMNNKPVHWWFYTLAIISYISWPIKWVGWSSISQSDQ